MIGPAAADTITETEPNDTLATANLTFGVNNLTITGALSSATDQDFFSFAVTALGVPDPPFSTAVRITVTSIPNDYHFAVIDPSGNTVISGNVIGPHTIDFNPNAVGGIGVYAIQIGATSPSSVGAYELLIFGVADGEGQPPVIVGSGSISKTSSAIAIPTLSSFGLLLLAFILICTSAAILHRPNHALNPDASSEALRAVRSAPVSLIR
jgi:hypothetical protein